MILNRGITKSWKFNSKREEDVHTLTQKIVQWKRIESEKF